MKKALLLAALAATVATSVQAKTDGVTYEDVNGFTCANKWIDSRNYNVDGWFGLPFAEMYAKARTATLGKYQGKDVVIVGFSKTLIENEVSNDYAHLVLIDFMNGQVIKTVQMTANGEPVKGLLCANQVGCDQFGHVWFAGYLQTTITVNEAGEVKKTPLNIYVVDDLDAGTCHKEAELVLPDDEAEASGRIDYCDLVGDITRTEANCVVMAALNADNTWVVGWACEQGGTEWTGAMDDYYANSFTDTYPADLTSWGTAPFVRIVLNEDYTNELFYVDGFNTCPSLYSNAGSMIDSFASAVELAPKTGTNGVGEFAIAGKNFIAYSMGQYDMTPGCAVRVAELGEGQAFEGMESYWVLPEGGLGEVSDGGTRIHAVETRAVVDKDGNEGAYLLTYKCNNGIGVYTIGAPGFVDPDDSVSDIYVDAEDANAPVEYFNLNGAAVNGNNLPAGLYITRQGKTVNKVVVK